MKLRKKKLSKETRIKTWPSLKNLAWRMSNWPGAFGDGLKATVRGSGGGTFKARGTSRSVHRANAYIAEQRNIKLIRAI